MAFEGLQLHIRMQSITPAGFCSMPQFVCQTQQHPDHAVRTAKGSLTEFLIEPHVHLT